MEWLLLVLAGGGAVWTGRRMTVRRARRMQDREELESVRRLADEDVTLLGEELRRLESDAPVADLDEQARVDYQQALDAYESAQRLAPRIDEPDEVSKVTDVLSTGRYALACVQAAADGRPRPEHRVPCFFNPQHGPSAQDVRYTPPGRGTRTVPACAQDVARLAEGESPEVRTVRLGSRQVPYWQAGAAYLPYGRGYFVGTSALPMLGASTAWAFSQPVAGPGAGFSPDYGGAGDAGMFGGGGFDGGFDGGGGDAGGS